MSKIHKIKGRIRGVAKIQQITKAMEKVAASKMRRAQEAALRSRAYAVSAAEALVRLQQLAQPADHALLASREEVRHQLLILFTSDRGLAGAYHSNLFRVLLGALTLPRTSLIIVGGKGVQMARKLPEVTVVAEHTPWPAEPTMVHMQPIIATALEQFTSGAVDSVRLVYTDFISSLQQQARVKQLLPLDPAHVLPLGAKLEVNIQKSEFEPSPRAVLDFVMPRLVGTQLFQAALEASASEHSMRMMAMKNASDNAQELAHDLTLTYNGARQAAITQELAEISAGADAIR
jgi:F-type H+-transporting ATPase subunit gamma